MDVTEPASSPIAPLDTRRWNRAAFAWILLDWAASAFSTALITLVVTYFERVVFHDSAWGVPAGVVWAWTLAAAMLASAIATPWLSAWADRMHAHRRALVGSVALGAGGMVVLGLVPADARLAIVAAILAAHVGFDLAAVFTGSLLPKIAHGPAADRLSAAGFAAGYAGGALALLTATALVAAHQRLGLTAAGGLQAAFLLIGAWWLCFSLPAALARFGDGTPEAHAATSTRELVAFARSLVKPAAGDGLAPLAAVLGGAVLVLGAVQTAIAQLSSVALEEFHLEGPALVKLVLLVQAVALPGALSIGWLAARVSRRVAIAACLTGWITVLAAAGFVTTVSQLYGLAVLLALVLGGVQSVIRAAVSDAAPQGRAGATFGLLQVGTKLTGFVASFAFGAVYELSGHPRAGLAFLALQVAFGWWALRRVR